MDDAFGSTDNQMASIGAASRSTYVYGDDEFVGPPEGTQIQPGDSLGEIVSRKYGSADPDLIMKVAKYNGLASGHDIRAGTSLMLPNDAQLRDVGVTAQDRTMYQARGEQIEANQLASQRAAYRALEAGLTTEIAVANVERGQAALAAGIEANNQFYAEKRYPGMYAWDGVIPASPPENSFGKSLVNEADQPSAYLGAVKEIYETNNQLKDLKAGVATTVNAARQVAKGAGFGAVFGPVDTAVEYVDEGKQLLSTDFAIDAGMDVAKGATAGAIGAGTKVGTQVLVTRGATYVATRVLGAEIGAAVGSIIPGAGTVIGAVVGFGIGTVVGAVIEHYAFKNQQDTGGWGWRDTAKDAVRSW